MKCHFVYDPGTQKKWLIPGCYGSLHRNDLLKCCCSATVKDYGKTEYNKEIKNLNEQIEYLTKEYNQLIRIIEKVNKKANDKSNN